MEKTLSQPYKLDKNDLDRYMAEISRYPLISREKEQELARHFRDHGDIHAAHHLVVSHLRFVVKIAQQFRYYGFKMLDLIQEGNIGLMMAVKKFDPEKGYRLISYAVWWIKASIQSFVLRSWSLVRLGSSRVQRKLFFRLREEKSQMLREQNFPETIDRQHLAQRLGVPLKDLEKMELRLAARDFSLDQSISDDFGSSNTSHLDLTAQDCLSQEEMLAQAQENKHLQGQVKELMASLNDKERYIVKHRLMSDKPDTLNHIGKNFDLTRERVRQLEKKVIHKLKAAFTSQKKSHDIQVAPV